MVKNGYALAFILSIIGTSLIVVNGLWIAANNSPIILETYPAYSTEQLYSNASSFWGRFSFGIPGYADTAWLSILILLGVIGLLCGLFLLIEPGRHAILSLIIIVCCILSIPIGGGFYVGAALGVVGGLAGIEWPRPLKETFMGRFLRALRLDPSLFETVSREPKYLSQAAWTLIFVNVLSAIGYGVYNLTTIAINQSTQTAFNVLFLGQITIDISVLVYPLIYIGIGIVKWLILSLSIYIVGTKIIGSKANIDRIMTATAFAYVPIALQVFLPVFFSNQLVTWGLAVFFFTNAWMILALVVSLRQSLEISLGRTIGVILLSGGIYWIIDFLAITPTLQIPGIWFIIMPATFVLMLFSIGVLIAALMGVFTKRSEFG